METGLVLATVGEEEVAVEVVEVEEGEVVVEQGPEVATHQDLH